MKDQYFGDINDYRKYGLLRVLTDKGRIRTAVCWMLTRNDERGDGRKIGYLKKPAMSRHDPDLFKILKQGIQERKVAYAKESGILDNAVYCGKEIPDNQDARKHFFTDFWQLASDCRLVFFDPDNGLEVKSKEKGHKNSNKYLYWDELEKTVAGGFSVLIYQHIPRYVKHDIFIRQRLDEFPQHNIHTPVYAFHARGVVFFLLPVERDHKAFTDQFCDIKSNWESQIKIASSQNPLSLPPAHPLPD